MCQLKEIVKMIISYELFIVNFKKNVCQINTFKSMKIKITTKPEKY